MKPSPFINWKKRIHLWYTYLHCGLISGIQTILFCLTTPNLITTNPLPYASPNPSSSPIARSLTPTPAPNHTRSNPTLLVPVPSSYPFP
jgi:hypothetical protein